MRLESLRDRMSQFPDVDGFWGLENPTAVEAAICRRLPAQDSDEWSLEAIEALTQLARFKSQKNELKEAKALLTQATTLLSTRPTDTRKKAEMRLELELGRWFSLSMNPKKAEEHFLKAWETAKREGQSFFATEAAVLLSLVQPPKLQLEWFLKALKTAESSPVDSGQLWLPQLYMMQGWRSFDGHRFAEALGSFEKALNQPRAAGDLPQYRVIQWSVARALRALERNEEALARLQTLHEEMVGAGVANGYVDLELAECLQRLGKKVDAKAYFGSAHTLMSEDAWYRDNYASDLVRMKRLSRD